jgi:hypothetical protein
VRSRARSASWVSTTLQPMDGGVCKRLRERERRLKIKRDQVFNTYFVPYTVGWKSVQPRPPPESRTRIRRTCRRRIRSRCIRGRSCRRFTTRIR